MKNHLALCVLVTSLLAATGCATKQGYVAKGNKLFDAGKYAEASLNYRKAIQKDPQYGEAYYRLGLSAIKQDQAAQAYQDLFRAVQLLPNNIDAKEKFADVCLAFYLADPRHPQNYYKQLTQISDELLSKNANSFDGFKIRAYLADIDRKPQEAIALFRTCFGTASRKKARNWRWALQRGRRPTVQFTICFTNGIRPQNDRRRRKKY
jgi:tetratricopeptide (TPR) repeat protein